LFGSSDTSLLWLHAILWCGKPLAPPPPKEREREREKKKLIYDSSNGNNMNMCQINIMLQQHSSIVLFFTGTVQRNTPLLYDTLSKISRIWSVCSTGTEIGWDDSRASNMNTSWRWSLMNWSLFLQLGSTCKFPTEHMVSQMLSCFWNWKLGHVFRGWSGQY
jgi:hypothetical protein